MQVTQMLRNSVWASLELSRSGLKKVHNNFPQIYRKLDAAYVGAQQRRLEKLMGGIVGIWAKMCSDSILRDKLFNEGTPLLGEFALAR